MEKSFITEFGELYAAGMRKIMVIGSGGAGKSTLARQLGEITGIEVIHLDRIFWKPNWTESGRDVFLDVQRTITAGNAWIIDGNYSGTMDIRLKEADTVIYLDYPTAVCLYRAIKRFLLNRGRTRIDMAEGCTEKIDKEFITWIWNFRRNSRPELLEKLAAVREEKNIVILSGPSGSKRFLKMVRETFDGRGGAPARSPR
jgi:adenylate kinase family enzyme